MDAGTYDLLRYLWVLSSTNTLMTSVSEESCCALWVVVCLSITHMYIYIYAYEHIIWYIFIHTYLHTNMSTSNIYRCKYLDVHKFDFSDFWKGSTTIVSTFPCTCWQSWVTRLEGNGSSVYVGQAVGRSIFLVDFWKRLLSQRSKHKGKPHDVFFIRVEEDDDGVVVVVVVVVDDDGDDL